jgi:mannose-1-phosphate guanylyltransferase
VKAFLLAAGRGSRLRPLTDTTPKCLVRVGHRALLDRWLDALTAAGVGEVLVNAHHLAAQVSAHLAARAARAEQPAVHVVPEPRLLGSAGTLRANRDFVAGEQSFLVVNADNLTDFDLRRLVTAHGAGGGVATLTVFRAAHPSECGLVELEGDRVVGFVEKPELPRTDLANAGMYAFAPELLEELPATVPADIGFDLLPRLVGRARAVPIGTSYFLDVGTPAALDRARRDWADGLVA